MTFECLAGVTNSLLAALTAAVAFVAIRYISKRESSLSIALSFHTMGVMTSVVPLAVSCSHFSSCLLLFIADSQSLSQKRTLKLQRIFPVNKWIPGRYLS